MSEQAPRIETHTNSGHYEHLKSKEVNTAKMELVAAQAENAQAKQLEAARQTIEQTAENITQLPQLSEQKPRLQPSFISKELRILTTRRALSRIRRSLPLPQRVLSNVIHQPVVRVFSDATAKTIARPLALLIGGLCAFAGTAAYYTFASRIGLSYNHSVWILFFVSGFAAGLLLEFVGFVFKHLKG